MHYTLKDHQGSLTATICGNTVERLSYDAWGRRRDPDGFGYSNVTHTFDRGYTLHEHYDDFGLINMNGRCYDPVIGRMLSPDVAIQDEHNMQAYNRYSYCFNNPLRFTDPSGYFVSDIHDYLHRRFMLDLNIENFISFSNAFNTDLSEGRISPIYDLDGTFLGVDDGGLQGEAIIMDRYAFRDGMTHAEAMRIGRTLDNMSDEEALSFANNGSFVTFLNHYSNLNSRPDWDGFVTIDEGIAWAKEHPNVKANPTSDNTLYINASFLDLGFLTVSNSGLKVGEGYRNVNLYDYVNRKSLRSINTTYALGNTSIKLLDNTGTISFQGDVYDWDYHENSPKRNALIFLERKRAGLNDNHGFKVKIYGTTRINKDWPF